MWDSYTVGTRLGILSMLWSSGCGGCAPYVDLPHCAQPYFLYRVSFRTPPPPPPGAIVVQRVYTQNALIAMVSSTISLPHHHFGRWGSWGHVDFPPFFQHLWATTVTGRILRCRRCWSLWFWERNVTTNCLSSSDSANPHQASDALPQSFVGSS